MPPSTPNKSKIKTPEKPFDCTLRMPRQEIDALRNQLEQSNKSQPPNAQRHFRRWPFERVPIRVKMSHPGGIITELQYACRNISGGGMSILHSAYVHPGTRCVAQLPCRFQVVKEVQGVVIRCLHRTGKVHEVAVKFDEPLDVREVLEIDPADNSLILESVKPENLQGTVLIVEDSELDRVLFRKYLADTNLDVITANTGAEGLKRAEKDVDIIICDYDLPDFSGIEMLGKLREQGNHTPMILVSAEGSIESRLPQGSATPDSVIPKPFKRQRLLGAIAEFLLADAKSPTSGALIYTNLDAADPTTPLVPNFIDEVRKYCQAISGAMMRGDTATCRRVAFQIRGSAPMFGFDQIAEAANTAYTSISASGDIAECMKTFQDLLSICGRIRARRDAA